jgi:hypothetical protein
VANQHGDSAELQPLLDVYHLLRPDQITRAERATRNPSFKLPAENLLDLTCLYADEVESIIDQDPSIQAITQQTFEHAYQLEERTQRLRTRRTVLALSLLALSHTPHPSDDSSPSPNSPQVAA